MGMSRNPVQSSSEPAKTPLRLMLSYGGWEQENFADQLPRLLEPLGIDCLRVGTADDVTSMLKVRPVHIAVIDVRIPINRSAQEPAGGRVLQILRRLESPPPTVVVRPRQATIRGAT